MVIRTEFSYLSFFVLLWCLLSTDARGTSFGRNTYLFTSKIKRAHETPSVVIPSSSENLPRLLNYWNGLDLWRKRGRGLSSGARPFFNTYQKTNLWPSKYLGYNNDINRAYVNPWFNTRFRAFIKPYNALKNAALGNSILGGNALARAAQLLINSRTNVDEDKQFIEDKIHEYYEQRLNKNKNQWMYKLVNGTSPHIKDIFIGRCWDFIANKGKYLKNASRLNCKKLWKTFKKAFAFKGPCDVTHDDYTPFFEMYEEQPLYNRVMLWSGTRELTHTFTGLYGKFTTLEDTLAGFLLNGLKWCGSKREPGINYTSCPYECSKQKPFFGYAAERLARRARGVVHVMLNGTRQHFGDKQIFPTFMDDSYLGQNQLSSLSVPDIRELRILVGHSLHHKSLERCGSLSVLELENRAKERGLKTTCYDNPYFIRHLLCLENPGDPLCLFKVPDQEMLL